MSGIDALYLVLLAGVAGYVLIARVPSILHTPMMSGSNFIHGIVLCGAMLALSSASNFLEQVIGFIAVMAAAANVIGGFVVTDRMLALFNSKNNRNSISLAGPENPASEDRRVPDAVKKPGSKSPGNKASDKSNNKSSYKA